MLRSLLITAAVSLLTPTMTLSKAATTAEYVSGTVKSIPANTTGSLDVASSTELRFHYGKSVFSLPYASITQTQIAEPVGKRLWRVPVPKLGRSERFLNISYQEGSDSRMLTFRTPKSTVTGLVNTINSRRKGSQGMASAPAPAKKTAPVTVAATSHAKKSAPAPAAAAPAPKPAASVKTDTEDWWGDRYWRTTRNKSKWPEVPAENGPGVPSGSKE